MLTPTPGFLTERLPVNMRERINDLMSRLNTAKVIPFPVPAGEAKRATG